MEQIWGLGDPVRQVSVRDCGKGPDVEFPVSLGFTVCVQAGLCVSRSM